MSQSNRNHVTSTASPAALVAGFASIYIIWGSTYLAIKFAVETLPPLLMGGVRFMIAGFILWMISAARRDNGMPRPNLKQFRAAAIVGTFMLAGGNGLVCWSEQWVPSGIAALIVGTVPIWMVLFDWMLNRTRRPSSAVFIGIAIGFAGIALLASSGSDGFNGASTASDSGRAIKWGVAALLLACVFWSYGSLRSRRVDQGSSMIMASAMQMIGGGASMLIIGTLLGEWTSVDLSTISMRSILSFIYLVLFGSLVGFTSYVWLLRVASPTAVSTYAYVNPIVAVFLGWWLGDEAITSWTVIAGAMVVGAVALMTMRGKRQPSMKPAVAAACDAPCAE